jgi:hypothetical protein
MRSDTIIKPKKILYYYSIFNDSLITYIHHLGGQLSLEGLITNYYPSTVPISILSYTLDINTNKDTILTIQTKDSKYGDDYVSFGFKGLSSQELKGLLPYIDMVLL